MLVVPLAYVLHEHPGRARASSGRYGGLAPTAARARPAST